MKIRKVTKHWTTKDGRKVRMCDMTDDHLRNTLKMLERNAMADAQASLASFGVYARFDWEVSQDWDGDLDYTMFLHPLYHDMIDEAERRGLTLTDLP